VSTKFTAGVRTNGRTEVENRVNDGFLGPKMSVFQVYQGLNERTKGQTIDDMIRCLRDHVGPFALQTCYREMKDSLFYTTSVIHLPEGVRNWRMLNTFTNDAAYISTQWLLSLITGRGLRVKQLLRISHIGSLSSTHCLAILDNESYLCDCCMGTNLGIPCRHYFQALTSYKGLKFHLGLV
ncbi:hypothetical protein CPB84DRAFT_1661456, partial [Gymnopilus junonius]